MGFFAEQNLKMLGATLTGSLFLTVAIFYVMQWLIDVGDVELSDKSIKIADVTMPGKRVRAYDGYGASPRRGASTGNYAA